MPAQFKTPKFPGNVPFYMFDIDNYQLITVPTIPGDIKDVKQIVYTEVPIPGMNFQPIMPGGGGNRKISFTLPLVKRNNNMGNIAILKQFDMLRNQVSPLGGLIKVGQFTSFPRVIFNYGIGSIPLIYYVTKCDATHKQGWTNALGNPQYSELEIELWLDENNFMYKGEEVFRRLQSVAGMSIGTADIVKSNLQKGYKPY